MRRRNFLWTAAVASLLAPGRALANVEKAAGIDAARARMRALAAEKKVAFPLSKPALTIHKKDRVMDLHEGKTLVKRYTVALGLAPEGPKRVQGDYKTPEGKYFICYLNYESAFHLFLGLSYPNALDADAGLAAKTIDAAQATKLRDSAKAKKWPSWGTGMGGAVGIHGGGSGSDWTWGCIAVSDDEVDEIWAACPVGTPVEILP